MYRIAILKPFLTDKFTVCRNPTNQRRLAANCGKALIRAGIENFRLHSLRRWHVQAGTPLMVLKELGGWAALDMVLRYAHLGVDHLAEHAERIAKPRMIRTNLGAFLKSVSEKRTVSS
ncbi:MAG: tyrosine-type recombinase/integrase [Synechococcaceae cyanobacterium SM1_2_3]|nr:tyrosine-type recombinase/integrase [Synechococcaceae cyanobacterium SM1_2_3]